MQIAHQRLQPLFQHMGIDLRGGNIGMAEQGLHHPQVGAVVQEVAGEGVAQHVRREPLAGDAAARAQRLQFAGEMLAGEMALLAERRKQPFRCCLAFAAGAQREIFGHGALGGLVERHQPLLAALAAHHQHSLVAPRGGRRQRHQFGDAQAGGVDDFQQAQQPRGAQARGRRLASSSAASRALRPAACRPRRSTALSAGCARASALPAPRPDRRRVCPRRRGSGKAGAAPTAAAPPRKP